ncbi:MAG: maleylpyruvate isomerase family mycothiol-dependent enzyme [Frankiaceae bacterium]|nr:maleylpyruvate isomerase family mycothiol-dependent enzyme [Frankiaceae bacterium]
MATRPRPAGLERGVAVRLAADENDRFLAQVRRLAPAHWSRPTDCSRWDVQSLVGHVVGMGEMAASLPEQMKQMRAAGKAGGVFIDALTALQVAKHAADTPEQLVARYAVIGPKAAKGRKRTPGFVRRRTMPVPQAVGGVEEKWTLGFLVDVILTRDTWMHRIDVARAVGQEPELTAVHDGVLVADVVAEWAGRHRQPCTLHLTGLAGGSWAFGTGGPEITQDAVEFCRGLSGRGEPALGTEVPF